MIQRKPKPNYLSKSATIDLNNVTNDSAADLPVSDATQTALNTKQATLISGTTIKTVGGSSLLGSGDVAVGLGSVTTVSIVTANGISGTVANATTTPAVTLALGVISPSSVSSTFTGNLTGNVTGNCSGTSGSATGNAATATALATGRTIGGVTFDGTAAIVPQTIQSVNEATDTTCFPLFISASGTQSLQPLNNAGLIYNSNTNALTATTFIGGLTGNATSATTASSTGSATNAANATNVGITDDTTTNATMYPTWVTTTTGNLPQKTSSSKLTFNPSTGTLTTSTVVANVTGNVTGNTSGSSGSCTGLAATATALATPRAINGTNFDGTAAITLDAALVNLTPSSTSIPAGYGIIYPRQLNIGSGVTLTIGSGSIVEIT